MRHTIERFSYSKIFPIWDDENILELDSGDVAKSGKHIFKNHLIVHFNGELYGT